MEFKEVKAWIETNMENEEVKSYLGELGKVTTDKIEKWIEEEEGKKYIGKINDKFFTKSLETWKQNNLEKELDKEIKKRFPEKDSKDIELEKVKAELEKIKADSLKKELTNKTIKTLTDKKLPLDIVDLLVSNDEEATNKNIEVLESVFNAHVESMVNEKLKGGYKPPKDGSGKGTLTTEDLAKMSIEEINANWDKVK